MGKIATFLKKKSPLIWELSTTTQITSIRSFLRVTAAPHKPRRCCTIHQNSKTKVCQRHPLSNLHVNIYDTKKSQTWEKQFWSRLLSSLQCGAQWGSPPPTHPAPQTELKMRNLEAGAEMSEDGIGVTWQAFISPFTTPCLWRHGGRRWEKEVQRLRAPGTDLISR